MIRIENTEVVGWEAAIRGMRNPMNSWSQSDSGWTTDGIGEKDICVDSDFEGYREFKIGPNDQKLTAALRNAGTDHRKFMRMIAVYCDITAPLYWWKEFDTYKVGTVANSCSTMHKIAAKEFTPEDFSCEHLIYIPTETEAKEGGEAILLTNMDGNEEYWSATTLLEVTIDALNFYREKYLEVMKKSIEDGVNRKSLMKKYWWQMIQLLPSSYNQRRTVMMNYEVLSNMHKSRKSHKLDEWRDFCLWIRTLPYSQLITGEFDIPEASDGEK